MVDLGLEGKKEGSVRVFGFDFVFERIVLPRSLLHLKQSKLVIFSCSLHLAIELLA